MTRTSLLVALMAIGATSFAVAQTPPPASTAMPPASTTQADTPTSPPPASTDSQTASPEASAVPDAKLQDCIANEKAKNAGLTDNQLKQKCMLEIGSHQGH